MNVGDVYQQSTGCTSSICDISAEIMLQRTGFQLVHFCLTGLTHDRYMIHWSRWQESLRGILHQFAWECTAGPLGTVRQGMVSWYIMVSIDFHIISIPFSSFFRKIPWKWERESNVFHGICLKKTLQRMDTKISFHVNVNCRFWAFWYPIRISPDPRGQYFNLLHYIDKICREAWK